MKLIQNKYLFAFLILLGFTFASAQEIIPEKTTEVIKPKQTGRTRVDGIIATVGDFIILDSDIDKSFLELGASGNSIKDITRCQMLNNLLKDKLFAHQAIQDSIIVKDDEIKEKMNQQMDYMVEQLGSMEKVISYFKKSNEDDLRTDLFEILKQQKLANEMQQKIISTIQISPEEARVFFKSIPEKERPTFGVELEISQIVINPKVTPEAKKAVIDKLNLIKLEVEKGASFATKAILYTDDPGSKSTGGFYKITKKTPFVKEFKDVAFALKEGEISEPFETEFGFHIIKLEKIKGQELELRHILVIPKVTDADLKAAKEKIFGIKKRIKDKEITFAEAAKTLSDEKETKTNGGVLVNPKTQDTHFELTKMDPELYSNVSSLKNGEISNIILEEDPKAGKKYKIIMVTNKIEEHQADFSKDFVKIKEIALKDKQIKALTKWTAEKIKETYIKINAEYKDCEFTSNWLKKGSL